MRTNTVRHVETLASRAWPALEILDLDGWRLRWSGGFTRRANSVWPERATGSVTLDQRIDVVEALYAGRGLRARYQISPTSTPAVLSGRLAERGYRREVDTSVETVSTTKLLAELTGYRPPVIVSGDHCPDPRWWEVWRQVEATTPAEQELAASILEHIPAPTLYAVATQDGRPVAVGRAVLDGGWLGVFSMATLPESRRQGVAHAVMRYLGMWGESGGAEHCYLQVEVPNKPARRLYSGVGFRQLYRYTYWSAPEATPAASS